jgi:hypothetical protein
MFSSNCRVEIYMVISWKIIEFPMPYVTFCTCKVLEKLIGFQQVLKFSTLCWTWKFYYCVYRNSLLDLTLSHFSPVHANIPDLFNIILMSSHLHLDLPDGSTSGFLAKICVHVLPPTPISVIFNLNTNINTLYFMSLLNFSKIHLLGYTHTHTHTHTHTDI